MNDNTVCLLETIEQLRREMVDVYMNSSTSLSDPEVVRISQLLDVKLNHLDMLAGKY